MSSNQSPDDSSLAPLTFKIPLEMLRMMDEIIASGEYSTKADLIRDAIQKLIDWELGIPSVKGD
ncbi:MAG: ribbon-helix-helix domain-containing protein [Candidatus Kariarchaeaceae archaeon]|jgi:Arc/MetJ-type ribon-helix-helix transcriptional regulator